MDNLSYAECFQKVTEPKDGDIMEATGLDKKLEA